MNNDTKTTVIGAVMAVATALGDVLIHTTPDGLNIKSPVFWCGLVVAAGMALKGYFTNKGQSVTTLETTKKIELTTPAAS